MKELMMYLHTTYGFRLSNQGTVYLAYILGKHRVNPLTIPKVNVIEKTVAEVFATEPKSVNRCIRYAISNSTLKDSTVIEAIHTTIWGLQGVEI